MLRRSFGRSAESEADEVSTAPATLPWSNLLPFASVAATDNGLALAASADDEAAARGPSVRRLPRDFDPLARFAAAENVRLPYTPASALPSAPSFDRPEGSFSVRAFGNVVHRFLQLVSVTLAENQDASGLIAELPSWQARLSAALRNEGLAPAVAQRESPRALVAVRNSLQDPVGKWILSAHAWAASEYAIESAGASVLRADRTFLAGRAPLVEGEDHLWIVDFKTTEQGSHSVERFEEDELRKYREQLERYAKVLSELAPQRRPVVLGLYYPLIPRLLHWTF